MIKKIYAVGAVVLFGSILAACTGGTLEIRGECAETVSAGTKCNASVVYRREMKPGDSFNASYVELEVNTTGAQVVNTSGQALVKVYRNSSLLGAQRFGYTRSGNRLYPVDAAAIDAWIRTFGTTPNKAELVVDDLKMVSPTGEPVESTLQLISLYGGVQQASSMTSYTYNPRSVLDPTHEQ